MQSRIAARRAGRQRWQGERCRRIPPLVRACQPHGPLEILRVVELDVDANVVRKALGEQLSLLVRREATGVRHARLKRIQVRINR